ncbi:heme exporter protein B [Solimonas aquatica]|uniref:Heme exporter protein B n=1 Tax=Solimonas aquatica TaxID=489703 RepID=A0A1H9HEJ2_9GAMM|nr:heme exporter protein CcmB [Solimonas aquatica]SEQ60745.1 heme exporter protein B [Solimonas aquatica]
MSRALYALLRRELQLAARAKTDWLLPPVFYAIVVALFSFGAKPGDPLLAAFAPAVIWVGALLSALLSLERLYRSDQEDGSLEQILVSRCPLVLAVLVKSFAHWLLSGLPVVLMAAPLALMLGFDPLQLGVLLAGLALGTPSLSLIGSFVAALTVGLPRGGALLPVLVLPLIVPVVIFGAGAVRAAQQGLDAGAPLYFLAAIFSLSLTLLPWLAAAALRNAFE